MLIITPHIQTIKGTSLARWGTLLENKWVSANSVQGVLLLVLPPLMRISGHHVTNKGGTTQLKCPPVNLKLPTYPKSVKKWAKLGMKVEGVVKGYSGTLGRGERSELTGRGNEQRNGWVLPAWSPTICERLWGGTSSLKGYKKRGWDAVSQSPHLSVG